MWHEHGKSVLGLISRPLKGFTLHSTHKPVNLLASLATGGAFNHRTTKAFIFVKHCPTLKRCRSQTAAVFGEVIVIIS